MNRRELLNLGAATGFAAIMQPSCLMTRSQEVKEPWLKMAVQQYSFNRQLRSGELKIEDYPKTVVDGTGIKALEYYNGHIEDDKYNDDFFKDLRKRCDDLGVINTLMLCRSDHALDSPKADIRQKSIESYHRWLRATTILGGQYIRVDTRHGGDAAEQKKYAVDGLTDLCAVAKDYGIGILVENHGEHSGNGKWLSDVMKTVNLPNCGTLPDFQNFEDYDPYTGVAEMMPFAKILCAKSKSFDENGNEENVDFLRMLRIAKEGGFMGYIGIEYEGHGIKPIDGINATHELIKKCMLALAGN